MWEYIKSLFQSKPTYQNLGALESPQEVIDAITPFGEIVAKANPVDWNRTLDPNAFDYPVSNQDGSSSCVAATRELIRSIMYFMKSTLWVPFSFKWVYSQRTNKPGEGMYAQDVLNIGGLPDDFMPSNNQSESQMNSAVISSWLKDVANVFELGTPINVPIKDIDTLASILQTTGKPVQIFVKFGPNEWSKVPKVLGSNIPYTHSITVLPEWGMYEGEKAVLIQDSWGNDLNTIGGKRILTESFYSKRNVFAQYWMHFKFEEGTIKKPKYTGTVSSLQDCLTYEGVFPANVKARGYFGDITKDAVIKFQLKYDINPIGIVGPVTTKKLKELYG